MARTLGTSAGLGKAILVAGLLSACAPLDEAAVAGMTLREQAAQLVMVWMSGGYAGEGDAELTRVASLVRDEGIGGIVISLGTPHGYVSRLNRLQEQAEVPLLVAADFEFGAGFRVGGAYALPNVLSLGGATRLPPAMALGAADDEELAREAGRITGEEARALGVHLAFAPVLDVNNNPENPVINTRSFGEDPERVAALGAAFIQGAREAGLLTTAKHFPGHGDTGTDSHYALPVIPADRARLDSLELVPFRRAIAEGVDAIMTAHVAAPRILGQDAPPATLSPYFMTELLRGDLGFEGALFTDALDMRAIADKPGEAAVRALEAGADVLLMPSEPLRAIAAVEEAVRSGRLTAERIEESVRRVLRLKQAAGLEGGGWTDPEAVPMRVGTAGRRSAADRMAARGLTLVSDDAGLVPLTGRVLSVTVADEADLAAGREFDRYLEPSARGPVAGGFDVVVVSVYSRTVPESVRRFARSSAAPVVLVSFGSPYVSLEGADAHLLAWDAGAQRAAADALRGRRPITGRLPVTLPPHARGHGLVRQDRLARVDSIIEAAIADGAAPGAALAVGGGGAPPQLRSYGRTDWAEDAPEVTEHTLWDLASLTKVVATTSAAMALVDDGRLTLDTRVGEHLAEWVERPTTVRQLLTHTSGLPPFRPFWQTLRGESEYRAAIAELELGQGETVYSDIGLMLLAFMVQEITGAPFDEHLDATLFRPLGMRDTWFKPPQSLTIAPTEVDTVYRHRHVRGEVHDENAHALGGVAGHAGLFSTAADMAEFAAWILAAARGEARAALPTPATVARFVAPTASGRALGWDTRRGAFGHTGFTGTSIWVHPERDLFVVLLTNRVNPTRDNRRHIALRRDVHDALGIP